VQAVQHKQLIMLMVIQVVTVYSLPLLQSGVVVVVKRQLEMVVQAVVAVMVLHELVLVVLLDKALMVVMLLGVMVVVVAALGLTGCPLQVVTMLLQQVMVVMDYPQLYQGLP
jgi:hypothetical protein